MKDYRTMSIRNTLLASGAALLALTSPASANEDDLHPEHVEAVEAGGSYDGKWNGHWQDDETWRGMWNGTFTSATGDVLTGRYVGTFTGRGQFVADDGRVLVFGEGGWTEAENRAEIGRQRLSLHAADPSADTRFAYSFAEREAWLADCRMLLANAGGYDRYDHHYRDDADGGLIGGLLGALGGGIAGNRIADGNRVAGTLIGAGIGGIAGAVIGSLIEGDDDGDRIDRVDANELYAARYCEAYLRRYELSGGADFDGRSSYTPSPVRMRTAAHHGEHGPRHGPNCTTTVREEWVENELPELASGARRAIPPRVQPSGKVVPVE